LFIMLTSTAHRPLPIAYCLLPTAYRLLPTAYCLPPTAHHLLFLSFNAFVFKSLKDAVCQKFVVSHLLVFI
jgi:hypothetical protein